MTVTPEQAGRIAALVETRAVAHRALATADDELDSFVLTLAPAQAGDTVEARTTHGDQQWRSALVASVAYYLAREPVFSFYVRFANKDGAWSRRIVYVGADVRRPEQTGPPA